MKTKNKQKLSLAKTLLIMSGAFTAFGIGIAVLLRGKNIAVLNSKGLIASEQRSLIIFAAVMVLSIAVPTVVILYFMAWKYRESSHTSTYHPEENHGKGFNLFIWTLPTAFMLFLALILVPVTHKLQPNKAIAAGVQPITIQVMALRWKWLFIYPDQRIATVNYVQIPKGVPVVFDLTADEAPMSSFWVPNLGGQLYAMTGHINRLNLVADELGDYQGRSAEINGAGFSGMKFTAKVRSEADFQSWVKDTQRSPDILDKAAYEDLVKPSKDNQATSYSAVDNTLYAKAVMKYMGSHGSAMTEHEGSH